MTGAFIHQRLSTVIFAQQTTQWWQQRQTEATVRPDSASNLGLQEMLIKTVNPLSAVLKAAMQSIPGQRLKTSQQQAPVFRNAPSNPPQFRNSSSNVPKNVAGPDETLHNSSACNKTKQTQDKREKGWIQEYKQAEELDEDWIAYEVLMSQKKNRQQPNPQSQNLGQA